MQIATIPFNKIVAGIKTIESRLNDDKRRRIKIGDLIEFSENGNKRNKITTRVQAIHLCSSFFDLFSKFPSEHFGGESKEFLLAEIKEFYSFEEQQQFGVVGIQISIE